MNEELQRSKEQRYLALENAFATIDAFVIPSTDPRIANNYDELKEGLLATYSEGLDMVRLNDLKYNQDK